MASCRLGNLRLRVGRESSPWHTNGFHHSHSGGAHLVGLCMTLRIPATRGFLVASCIAVAIIVAALARPQRYQVEGLSMAPGLRPGDVVATGAFSAMDRFRRARRFDRWILTAPDGTPAIKRVVGLPGEAVSIADGDLSIDGRRVLMPLRILAETASIVTEGTAGLSVAQAELGRKEGPWQRAVSLTVVHDDEACAPGERRTLLPVHDVGLAAVIRLREPPLADAPIRVLLRIGTCVVPWRVHAAGIFAVVAGRLDGHCVGAGWSITDQAIRSHASRSCLPPRPPAEWQVALPWPTAAAHPEEADNETTELALGITAAGEPLSRDHGEAMIQHLVMWRGMLHRPAADRVMEWQLGPDALFVLGDFPSASRDSRHWGPLERRSLQSRVLHP